MKRLIHIGAALAVLSVAAEPRAGATINPSPTVTFEAVDRITAGGTEEFFIGGLVQGETQARTILFYVNDSETREVCRQFALLAQSKPGRYLLTIDVATHYVCTLVRR